MITFKEKQRRKKISLTLTGRKKTKEHIEKVRLAQLGKPRPSIRGNKNHKWKGNKVSYRAFHYWLVSNFGPANDCENKGCIYPRVTARGKVLNKPQRFEWALLLGKKYLKNRKNYVKLCSFCHRQYDIKGEPIYVA